MAYPTARRENRSRITARYSQPSVVGRQGYGLLEATREAPRPRFRPIRMTAVSLGTGVAPLTIAGGGAAR